jgi:hypothetical protein
MCSVEIRRDAPVGDENHSIIDLTIEEIAVKLSASWFLEGTPINSHVLRHSYRERVSERDSRERSKRSSRQKN